MRRLFLVILHDQSLLQLLEAPLRQDCLLLLDDGRLLWQIDTIYNLTSFPNKEKRDNCARQTKQESKHSQCVCLGLVLRSATRVDNIASEGKQPRDAIAERPPAAVGLLVEHHSLSIGRVGRMSMEATSTATTIVRAMGIRLHNPVCGLSTLIVATAGAKSLLDTAPDQLTRPGGSTQ